MALSGDNSLLKIANHHSRLELKLFRKFTEFAELVWWNNQLCFLASYAREAPEVVLKTKV